MNVNDKISVGSCIYDCSKHNCKGTNYEIFINNLLK